MFSRVVLAMGIIAFVSIGTTADADPEGTAKCQAAKLKAINKFEKTMFKLIGKALVAEAKGKPVNVEKIDGQINKAFGKTQNAFLKAHSFLEDPNDTDCGPSDPLAGIELPPESLKSILSGKGCVGWVQVIGNVPKAGCSNSFCLATCEQNFPFCPCVL